MVEYSYEEALELLENNVSVANERLVRTAPALSYSPEPVYRERLRCC